MTIAITIVVTIVVTNDNHPRSSNMKGAFLRQCLNDSCHGVALFICLDPTTRWV